MAPRFQKRRKRFLWKFLLKSPSLLLLLLLSHIWQSRFFHQLSFLNVLTFLIKNNFPYIFSSCVYMPQSYSSWRGHAEDERGEKKKLKNGVAREDAFKNMNIKRICFLSPSTILFFSHGLSFCWEMIFIVALFFNTIILIKISRTAECQWS